MKSIGKKKTPKKRNKKCKGYWKRMRKEKIGGMLEKNDKKL